MEVKLKLLPILMLIKDVIGQGIIGYPADPRMLGSGATIRSFGGTVGGAFGGQRSAFAGSHHLGQSAGRGTSDLFHQNLQLDTVASGAGFVGRSLSRGMTSSRTPRRGGPGEPEFLSRLIGSTVAGRELRMGEMGLPRHGGAGIGERHANGLLDGWDGNPQTLTSSFHDPWTDPFRGGPVPHIPLGFSGDVGRFFGRRPGFW